MNAAGELYELLILFCPRPAYQRFADIIYGLQPPQHRLMGIEARGEDERDDRQPAGSSVLPDRGQLILRYEFRSQKIPAHQKNRNFRFSKRRIYLRAPVIARGNAAIVPNVDTILLFEGRQMCSKTVEPFLVFMCVADEYSFRHERCRPHCMRTSF